MRIEPLTSLRFFAALMVVFSHMSFLQHSESALFRTLYEKLFFEGYIGVTFFFILSGFILSYSYDTRLKNNTVTAKAFYIARIARIYPLHLLTLLFALPLSLFLVYKNGGSLLAFLPNMTLTHAFFPYEEVYFSLNAPSWSLSVEMFFYLLFPFLLFARTSLLTILALAVIGFQIFLMTSSLSEDAKHFWIYIFPISRLIDFIAGIGLFRLYTHLSKNNYNINPVLLQSLSLFLFALFFLFKESVSPTLRYDLYYVIPFGLLILAFAFQGGRLADMLSTKLLVLLGEASFALYLIHQPIMRYFGVSDKYLFKQEGMLWDSISVIVILSISILASLLIYLLFEKSATKKCKTWFFQKIEGL